MYLFHPDSNCSKKKFNFRIGIGDYFFHECYMSNAFFTAPYWRNKSRIMMPPSDDGPYLTYVWIVLMRMDRGRPYLTIGDVITWYYLFISVISVKGYYKFWEIVDLRAYRASYFCMLLNFIRVDQVSAIVLKYFTWSWLFCYWAMYIPKKHISSYAFREIEGLLWLLCFF